jgi:hypothetical protein
MSGPGREFGGSFEPGEILFTAEAIARRQLQDFEAAQNFAEDMGLPQQRLSRSIRERMLIASTTIQIRRIEDPSLTISINEVLEGFGEKVYEEVAEEIEEELGESVTGEEVREFFEDYNGAFWLESGAESQAQEQFARLFGAAESIAAQNNTSIAKVYDDEELFAAAHREAYTLEEFIELNMAAWEQINERSIVALALEGWELSLTEGEQAEMDEADMIEAKAEIQLNPVFQRRVQRLIDLAQAVSKHYTVANIVRFWGSEALQSLPEDIQAKLDVETNPLNSQKSSRIIEIGGFSVRGATEEQVNLMLMREAFAKRYFEERGWDMTSPSIEQIVELHSQPGWNSPTID